MNVLSGANVAGGKTHVMGFAVVKTVRFRLEILYGREGESCDRLTSESSDQRPSKMVGNACNMIRVFDTDFSRGVVES